MSEFDYAELGLVAGLEIHQQLDTETKLFCSCPAEVREDVDPARTFTRYLHPTSSELGEIDEAALEESKLDREFEYLAYEETCLVEEDDEPPRRLDEEALEVALEIASLLGMEPLDQAHVMRKVVIDGSNTSGFQRTAMVARDGEITTEAGPVGVEDLMLEEESARQLADTETGTRYALDRLGIPLVEIGTDPDIRSPAQAQAAAERIGMLLRSTGTVKRGLGTIRQDVNVSIGEGARVEIKGVQSLEDIEDIVRLEVERQATLADIADELVEREAAVGEPREVTDVLADTESSVVQGALAGGGGAYAVRLGGFDGLLGREIQPDRRLGTELADHARRRGAGGIFHTDELPGYGLTEDDVAAVADRVDAGADDAVALVAADDETAAAAVEAAAERARRAIEGVPEETRGANDDGTTEYLRPLPGAARMYPETDVPPVEPDLAGVEPPELLTEKVERYQREYDLGEGLAEQVAYGRRMGVFEAAVGAGVDPTLAADTLESTATELRRDGVPVETLADERFLEVLDLVEAGDIAKEGVGEVLAVLAETPHLDADQAAEEAGLTGVDEDAVRETIAEVVERNADQVAGEGMGAFSALMGECMEALRGKADGELVSDLLREEIQRHLE